MHSYIQSRFVTKLQYKDVDADTGIKGIYYSVRNPSLFVTIKSQIYKSMTLSLVVTLLFFALFYIPQVAILAFTTGPLAFIGAIPLVLGEAAVTSRFLAKGLWLSDAQEKLFDTVRNLLSELRVFRLKFGSVGVVETHR